MINANKIFLTLVVLVQLITYSIIMGSIYVMGNTISKQTFESLEQQSRSIISNRMKERVENMILYIEYERKEALKEVQYLIKFTAHSMLHIEEEDVVRHLNHWLPQINTTEHGEAINCLMYDKINDRYILFSDGQATDITFKENIDDPLQYMSDSVYSEMLEYSNYRLYFFTTQKDIDTVAKHFIYRIIHTSVYGKDGYVWVNEIVDFNGGDNFAIRKIHPISQETEGRYLSTKEADITGYYHYAKELEGIKKWGEVFYTFHAENKSDGKMVEKATYSKLYQPFNWVVSTAEPLGDILGYAEIMNEYNQKAIMKTSENIIIMLFAVFAVNIIIIYVITRRQDKINRAYMEEKLAENDRIFSMVARHSDRMLFHYDIESGKVKPWNEDECKTCPFSHMCFKTFSLDGFKNSDYIMGESRETAVEMLENIRKGVPFGSADVHVYRNDGRPCWLNFKHTTLSSGDVPVGALISFKDITEQKDAEAAYQAHLNSSETSSDSKILYVRYNLTTSSVEKIMGQMFTDDEKQLTFTDSSRLFELLATKISFKNKDDVTAYFSSANLMELYNSGKQTTHAKWSITFKDGKELYARSEIILLTDPFSNHIKAFIRFDDITEEENKQLDLIKQGNSDAMTGLLRRGSGEALIRECLESQRDLGGIFIILDLDDLKHINDNFGHINGDKAIIGIAETLKNHFRKDDIIMRSGGDEFIAFLPGASKSVSSVELSMISLLHKLSNISLEDGNTIHCSAGCAVETLGKDTFESLYKKADTALYHVKRNGKNNFAFYVPEMDNATYKFSCHRTIPLSKDELNKDEIHDLIDVMSSWFPGIVYFNLSQNFYRILAYGNIIKELDPDKIDVFWDAQRQYIHKDDFDNLLTVMSRGAIMKSYSEGMRRLRASYRMVKDDEEHYKTEAYINLCTSLSGDVCAFLFMRKDTTPDKDREILRLRTILEMRLKNNCEYVCLINVQTGTYSNMNKNNANSHEIPELAGFDTVTKYIRDTFISPEQQDEYYNAAKLDTILENMQYNDSKYSYTYTLKGCQYEAVFVWYEESRVELLMTVTKISD